MPVDPERVQAVFVAAAEPESAAARADVLDRLCGTDAELRQRVETLLRAHDVPGSFLESPAAPPVPTVDEPPVAEVPGRMIGSYKLLEQIGEGGFGVVYLAEQQEPVRRKVALKVLKPGMDTRQVVARFEAERQALAIMDHPNIARVFDGGATPPGRPYFVMELVRGVPITEFCDQNHLTPRRRLELFVVVCQAVQHAHQKGIIHRDLKPSNILVTVHDTTPVPKVIDFGIAKALGQELTDKTLFTGFAQMIGTPLYMSPEQAGQSGLDVDTRSDIYSLGVLLYELLTGTTPFDRERLSKVGYDELRRIIREEEPPRPSTRISTLGQAAATVSVQRRSDPRRLSQLFRGELDWIVMKALEKDRSRRYDTANAFAQDVERYLHDEPVQACPPSAWYRFRKFARRNTVGLTTVALVSLALLLGSAISAWQAVRATEAEEQSVQDAAEKEQALEDKLGEERRRADALEKWRRTAYYLKTALALNEYRASNLARAEQLLDECPEELRHWEWHYLKRLCHSELRTVPLDDHAGYVTAAFSADSRRLALVDTKGVLHICDTATGKETLRIPVKGQQINTVRFSPDSKRVGVCGDMAMRRGVLQVWDADTGKEFCSATTRTRKAGAGQLWGLAFSPDGKHVAAADMRGHVHVIDMVNRKPLFDRDAHVRETPNPRRFQPVVDTLAAPASMTGTSLGPLMLMLGALGTSDLYPMMLGPPWGIVWFTSVAYSPDGKLLVSVCEFDQEIKLWNARTGDLVQTLTGGGEGFSRVAFSPSGKSLVTAGRYLDTDIDVPDPTVSLWDLQSGRTRRVLRGSAGGDRPVWGLAFSPDGRRLTTGRHDGTLTVWDVEAEREIGSYRGQPRPAAGWRSLSGLAFSADGRQFLALEPGGRALTVWDATRGAEARPLGASFAFHAAFSPDGRRVAAAARVATVGEFAKTGEYGTVLWDAETGQELMKFVEKYEWPHAVAFSPDGALIAVAVSKEMRTGGVKVFDLGTGKLLRTLPDPAQGLAPPCDAVAFSPDGKRIASGSQDRVVRIWDATTGKQLWEGKGHSGTISAVAFSRDGRRLASASGGIMRNRPPGGPVWPIDLGKHVPDLKVWDAVTGEELLSLNLPGKTRALAISPDGEVVAAAFGPSTLSFFAGQVGTSGRVIANLQEPSDGDRTVRLYRVATGEELRALKGHTRPCQGVAFSPDGRRLVTAGGADETVKLWDAQTGEEILTIGRHPGRVNSVAFSPDGHKIVSASLVDVRVWDATPVKK